MPNIDDQTFEQSFAEMAISDLQSKAPALMNYMLGFQLVEKSDDGARAIGFAGFKIGENWLYTPAFFLGGEILGGFGYVMMVGVFFGTYSSVSGSRR